MAASLCEIFLFLKPSFAPEFTAQSILSSCVLFSQYIVPFNECFSLELSSARSSARERLQQRVSVVMDSVDVAEVDSVVSPPYPSRDDEYGIPILHLDSESEVTESQSSRHTGV